VIDARRGEGRCFFRAVFALIAVGKGGQAPAEQSVTPDRGRRRELVQQANLLASDKVAAMFIFHPVVTRKEVNYPAANRIPDLVDLDLVTVET
jgi:hypothetical protein